tara:strand:+ start:405 stop:827 length:423 start_codon:yes stop_codon:yes gene_type:complete
MIQTQQEMKTQYTSEALDLITNATSLILNVSHTDIMSTRRDKQIVDARRIAYYLARQDFKFTLQAIANFFDKNHATILHQVNQHKAWSEQEDYYKNQYESVRTFLLDELGMEQLGEYLDVKRKINSLVQLHKESYAKNKS